VAIFTAIGTPAVPSARPRAHPQARQQRPVRLLPQRSQLGVLGEETMIVT